jgi:hypothetical protein
MIDLPLSLLTVLSFVFRFGFVGVLRRLHAELALAVTMKSQASREMERGRRYLL